VSALASVLGVGASTPFGLDATQSALFVRALKLVPRPTSFEDGRGERMGTVRAYRIPDDVTGPARMLALAASAFREAAGDAGIGEEEPLKVFVALPELERPLDEDEGGRLAESQFLSDLERRARRPIDRTASAVLRAGHAGFAVVLERALAHAAKGPVAVGAVDTYHHPGTLRWLDEGKRLLGDVVHNGFIPSEGAAFLIVAPPKIDRPVLARVTGVFSGQQPRATDDEPRIAETMTELVRRAARGMRQKPVAWVLSDVNGEHHRTKEWTFTSIRNRDVLAVGRTREDRLYTEMGDVGAATGALYASHAVVAFRTGFAPAEEVLVALASEGDVRGVFTLEAAS
jgi:3-oxoacyl-[acyl-carrier-protein] synthase-1